MRRLALASVSALFALGVQGASAADLPVKAAPVVAPAFSWTGVYWGAQVGGAWSAKDFSNQYVEGGVIGTARYSADGWFAGSQMGFNWQIGRWVIGSEAEWAYADIKGSVVGTAPLLTTLTFQGQFSTLAAATYRLGYTPIDRMLFYVKGGGAATRAEYSAYTTATGIGVNSTQTRLYGYTVGGGFEHAFLDNWSWKVEYMYYGFQGKSILLPGIAGTVLNTGDPELHTVKLGMNYRFNWRATPQ